MTDATKDQRYDSRTVHGGERHERPAGEHRQRREQPRQREHRPGSRRAAWSSRTSSISRSRRRAATTSASAEAPVGLEIGLGTRAGGDGTRFLEGNLAVDERTVRIAIEGDGFFQISLPNGTPDIRGQAPSISTAQGPIVTRKAITLDRGSRFRRTRRLSRISKDGDRLGCSRRADRVAAARHASNWRRSRTRPA